MSVLPTVPRLPVLWLVAALSLWHGAALAADRDRLEAFLAVTGFDVALDSIALSAADAPAMIDLAPEDFGLAWPRITAEVFDTAAMRRSALDILAETMDDAMLGHAAAFYASDLGQRLVEVENAAHMRSDDEARRAEGEALLATMEAGRRAVLERMTDAVDASGQALLAVQAIQFRFLMAASAAGLTEGALDAELLRLMLAQGAEEMRAPMRASALANAAQTYQDIPTGDLRAYAEALAHPVMARVYELMNAVQYEIMADRFEALALRLAEVPPAQDL
ncbi:DUF2059 domain-containing protein [Roseovarius autotrophicus]|uniref:DUF2059 domain-containing protein n=1 Tax=Roseovarius autotrophicus TaxID=2824121 RepID=UPI001FFC53D3|nr:DUF2059 domain-containing protein [Roseovarius autotrophicus]